MVDDGIGNDTAARMRAMSRCAGPTPTRHFRIPDDLYRQAAAKTRREGRNLSWIIRTALQLYLAGKLPLDGDNEKDPSP